eukprot:4616207-Amphidinium_carterae.1
MRTKSVPRRAGNKKGFDVGKKRFRRQTIGSKRDKDRKGGSGSAEIVGNKWTSADPANHNNQQQQQNQTSKSNKQSTANQQTPPSNNQPQRQQQHNK